MTDSPTLRLPIARLDPDEVKRLRRQGSNYRARRADLERATHWYLLNRTEATIIAARMSSWRDTWPEETDAVKVLMARKGITNGMITDERRRLIGSR